MALTVYWNPTTGNNSNSGLTPLLPKKNLYSARGVTGVTEIILQSGYHLCDPIPARQNQENWITRSGTAGSPIVLRGENPASPPTLDWSLIPNDPVTNADQAFLISGVNYVTWQDFNIINVDWQRAVRVTNCTNIILENINISNVYRHGIRADGDNLTFINCHGTNLVLNNAGGVLPGGWDTGFGTTAKSGGVNSTNIQFINCTVSNCWGEGVALFNVNGFTVDGCTVDNAYSVLFYVSGSANGQFADNIANFTDATYQRPGGLQRAFSFAAENTTDLAPTNIDYLNNTINGNNLIDNGFNFALYNAPSNNQYYDDIIIDGNTIKDVTTYGLRCQTTDSPTSSPTACSFQNNEYQNIGVSLYNIGAPNLPAWTIANNNEITDNVNQPLTLFPFPPFVVF